MKTTSSNSLFQIKKLGIKNAKKIIVGKLNINLLSNKLDRLKELVNKYVDILVITNTNLDHTFPTFQFLVDGFSEPFTLDRNRNSGGGMLLVREDKYQVKLYKTCFSIDFYFKLNFRKCKSELFGVYHPPSQEVKHYYNNLD